MQIMLFSTAASLHKRRCPNLGRYQILEFAPSHALSATVSRRQRRSELSKTTKRRTWQDNLEDEECRSTDIQVGCTSSDQAEIIIGNTCEHEKIGKYIQMNIYYFFIIYKKKHTRSKKN